MKTGTSCTRCANAATCRPKHSDVLTFGECRWLEPRRKWKLEALAYHTLRWLKIWGLTLALVRVGEFFKNMGQNGNR